ncbi:hypothetical protein [Raineya orbicola]|jgi:hypothetical protein|uniref:Uncharacterized protein n=1 Tax=Raineya orbicola TaxID=2016530 RepID=A0A2N3IIZ4_9BACT|nr:hypothetical protein [Raineya orbicola]PKQ70241.1 hypothetical protein Rain11_0762 [Raineya orbicola]
MKKLVTLLGLLLVGNYVLSQSLAPYQKQITLEKINVDAWAAGIEKGTEDDLKDAFSAYVKKNFNLKSKKNGRHGLVVPEATLPQVTTRRGDLHVQFSNDTGRPEMAVAFMMGYDIYLNARENPQEMERFKEFFTTFLFNYYKEYYEKMIREKEKMLKDLRSQIADNEKKVKSLQSDIEKTQKKIAKESDQLKKTELENKNVVARRQIDALNEMNANNNKQITNIENEINQIKMQMANIGK